MKATGSVLSHQRCRGCGVPRDARVLRPFRDLDPLVAERAQRAAGSLPDDAPLCPSCVGMVVDAIGRERGDGVLHDRIQASWPLDPEKTFGVLPVPLRLHANPLLTGRGVVVAFLDSGFYAHPDLVARRNRILAYVDATREPVEHAEVVPSGSLSWHGLMTSSVAVGDGTASGGLYRGLASDAELVLVKITDPRGGVHDADIERGLRWVLEHHRRFRIRVLNLSVGGDLEQAFRDSPVDQLVTRLVREGVVVVCAAGNAGQRRLVPPASAPAAITVGGLDDRNLLDQAAYRIWHSNYGPTVDGVGKPELVAPSIWVAAPILPGTDQEPQSEALAIIAEGELAQIRGLFAAHGEAAGLHPGLRHRRPAVIRAAARRLRAEAQFLAAGYKQVEGTSFAAPIVSSIVATMIEANRCLTPSEIKEILVRTAERVPNVESERQGAGVVDPREAVSVALRAPGGALAGFPFTPRVEGRRLHFLFFGREVRPLAIVGDFNQWSPEATPFEVVGRDVYEARLAPVPSAPFRYQVLLEDGRLMEDPEQPRRVPDGFRGWTSRWEPPRP